MSSRAASYFVERRTVEIGKRDQLPNTTVPGRPDLIDRVGRLLTASELQAAETLSYRRLAPAR
jgi:hypothetical protein